MASLATSKLRQGTFRRSAGAPSPCQPSARLVVPRAQAHASTSSQMALPSMLAATAAMLMLTSPMPAYAVAQPSQPPLQAGSVIQGPARVVDGDTLVINEQRVRLFGIDAPEKAQSCKDSKGNEYSCGQRSKEELTSKVGSQVVKCTVKNQDQYGRNVSVCSLGPTGEELNSWLVKNGLAVAYRQFGADYVPLEEQAKASRVGVWAGPFTPPNEWRKEQKASGAATAVAASPKATVSAPPPTCPGGAPATIKGNIGSKGDKIYHVPGGRSYDAVKIELSEGERWFCTEAEAQAAGWRASKV